jgi:hypothetical protein
MDASKLIKMRTEAANVVRSNWQPRDASEVTQIKTARAAAEVTRFNAARNAGQNVLIHQGPQSNCCNDGFTPIIGTQSTAQPGGFSTTYSYDAVRERTIGCTLCSDVVYGKSGVTVLKDCSDVALILSHAPNPVKGRTADCCYSTEVVQRGVTGNCEVGPCPPAYTGYLNQVPTNGVSGGRSIQ